MKGTRHKFSYSAFDVNKINNTRILNLEDETVCNYSKDVSKFKTLTQEEEENIIIQIKNGSKNSNKLKNILIGSHQSFVIKFAKKHCHSKNDSVFMDLVQEGNYGLLVALENFNPENNVKFLSYANAWVLKYMYQFLQDNELIQNNNRSKTFGIDNKLREEFMEKYGYEPSSEELLEIFNEMGAGLKHKSDVDKITIVSIDGSNRSEQQDSEDEDEDYGFDICSDADIEDNVNKQIIVENVNKILNSLTNDEKNVIIKKFGFDMSNDKSNNVIAEELNMDVNQVKKLINSSYKKFMAHKELFE